MLMTSLARDASALGSIKVEVEDTYLILHFDFIRHAHG